MKLPKIESYDIKSAQDTVNFARHFQTALDSADIYPTKEELIEYSKVLDQSCVYTGREVAFVGIIRKTAELPEEKGVLGDTLEEGLSSGMSTGFGVLHIDAFEPGIGTEEYEIYERLRAKARGEFLVCNLLANGELTTTCRDDFGTISYTRPQTVAPIISSDVHVFGEQDSHLNGISSEDVVVISRALTRPSRKTLKKLFETLGSKDEPLTALVAAAPYINRFLSKNNGAIQNAFVRTLVGSSEDMVNKKYRFRSLPPVLVSEGDKSKCGKVDTALLGDVFIEGLSINTRYFADGEGKVHFPKKPLPGLFIDIAAPIGPGRFDRFSIPAALLKQEYVIFV